jgi:hypothetical protein
MKVNQNFSHELDIYPRINLMSLSSNSVNRLTRGKLSALRTGLSNLKTQRKTTIDTSKDTCKTTTAKTESKDSSKSLQLFHRTCGRVQEITA